MIEAVIFDMDGLMFDTETLMLKVFPHIGQKYGVDIPVHVVHQLIGCDSRTVQLYEEHYPGIIKCMEDYQQNRLEYFFELNPNPGDGNMKGLDELIHYLNEKEIPYAIASSSHTKDIQRLSEYANCDIEPAQIVSSKEDGIPSKPSPVIFQMAAKRLGIEPEKCLVLEDSKYGIMAARRAGMDSMFIPDQVMPDKMMYLYILNRCESLLGVIEYLEKERS